VEDVAVIPSENFVDGYYVPYNARPSTMSSMESRSDVGCGHLFQASVDECNEVVSDDKLDSLYNLTDWVTCADLW
jgi:hypothetical protein